MAIPRKFLAHRSRYRIPYTRRCLMSEPVSRASLSLQQQCFSYVAHHLEEFPAEVLALLPVRIRKELLLILAPADIFHLEGGKVTEGVDMIGVWESMKARIQRCENRLLNRMDVLPLEWKTSIHSDPREYVNFIAGYPLFHERFHDVGHLRLQPLPHAYEHERLTRCFFSCVLPAYSLVPRVPHRYERFFSLEAGMRETAAFLLHHCRITLRRLFCSVRMQWFFLQLKHVPHELMQEIFGSLEEICFFVWDMPARSDDNVQVFSSVLSAALTHSSASFHTLILRNLSHDSKDFMKRATELFSTARGYPGLKHLQVCTRHSSRRQINAEYLKRIVYIFQDSLQELYLEEWWPSYTGKTRDRDLCWSICSLMKMPQFVKLSLFSNHLTMEMVYELLRVFLQSPCQELHMVQNCLPVDCISVPPLGIEMAEGACEYKHISLRHNVSLSNKDRIGGEAGLLSLLLDVHKLRLKSLRIPHASSHLLVERIVCHKDALVKEIQVFCDSPHKEGCTSKQTQALLVLASRGHLEKVVIMQHKLHPEIASFQQRLGFTCKPSKTCDPLQYYEFTLSDIQSGATPIQLEDFIKVIFSQYLSIKRVLLCFSRVTKT